MVYNLFVGVQLASEMMAESSLQDLVNIIINGVKFPPIEPKS